MIVSTDSRAIYSEEPLMRNANHKILPLSNKFAFAGIGLAAAVEQVWEALNTQMSVKKIENIKDMVFTIEDLSYSNYKV